MWWRCGHYFVIASCGYMPIANRCMYMAHVCCVAAVVKDMFFSLGVLKYVVCLCKGCDGCCAFSLYCDA